MSDEKCKEQVFREYHYHRCERKAWKDGYCKQHHPELVKERRAKQQEEYDAKWEARYYCKWTEEPCGPYKTQCGHSYFVGLCTLAEDDYRYCPYCGKQIKVTP